MGSCFDWATHLIAAPDKRLELAEKEADKIHRQSRFALNCATTTHEGDRCIVPLPQDNRFSGDVWQTKPSNMIYRGFLLQQQWWHNVVTGVLLNGFQPPLTVCKQTVAGQRTGVMMPTGSVKAGKTRA